MTEPASSCQRLRDSFELYALGLLKAEERIEVDVHIAAGCETCTRAISEALALNGAILSLIPEEDPPSALKNRILSGIGYEHVGWFWLGALAAVIMLVVALWIGIQERERSAQLADARRTILDISGQRDQLAQALRFLSDPETKSVAFGRSSGTAASQKASAPRGFVLLNRELGVMLIAAGLPNAGQGKTYQMWLTPKGDASSRSAGTFSADGARSVHVLAGPISLSELSSVSVSIEPEAGSSAPTTSPLIKVPVGS